MRRSLQLLLILMVVAALTWFLLRTQPTPPIAVGFLGGLTGRNADLGVPGRDGTLLAVEDVNARGGIAGRSVELVVRDDQQDSTIARVAMQSMIDEGVVAVIGPMTSSVSTAVVDLANDNEVLLMSPTGSTHLLDGKSDWFFRVYPSTAISGKIMAHTAHDELHLSSALAVLDLGNRAYVESLSDNFRAEFESLGGELVGQIAFRSGSNVDFGALASQIVSAHADGVLVLANAMDTAMLCQQLYKANDHRPMLVGEWSAAEELIGYGGRAVERIHVLNTFDRTSDAEDFSSFQKRFRERFGYEPGFAATHAYDAANVVLTALERDPNAGALPETIQAMETFHALQGEIRFDAFGDVERELFLVRVREGDFQLLGRR